MDLQTLKIVTVFKDKDQAIFQIADVTNVLQSLTVAVIELGRP